MHLLLLCLLSLFATTITGHPGLPGLGNLGDIINLEHPPTGPGAAFDCSYWHGGHYETRFYINGTNFPQYLLGRVGKGLKDNLQACGPVRGWQFDGSGECFTALAIFEESKNASPWCATGALAAVGGPLDGNCTLLVEHHIDKDGLTPYGWWQRGKPLYGDKYNHKETVHVAPPVIGRCPA